MTSTLFAITRSNIRFDSVESYGISCVFSTKTIRPAYHRPLRLSLFYKRAHFGAQDSLAKGTEFGRIWSYESCLCDKIKSRKPCWVHGLSSESAGVRTLDLRIKSPLLYQLSYALNVLHSVALRRKNSCFAILFAIRRFALKRHKLDCERTIGFGCAGED